MNQKIQNCLDTYKSDHDITALILSLLRLNSGRITISSINEYIKIYNHEAKTDDQVISNDYFINDDQIGQVVDRLQSRGLEITRSTAELVLRSFTKKDEQAAREKKIIEMLKDNPNGISYHDTMTLFSISDTIMKKTLRDLKNRGFRISKYNDIITLAYAENEDVGDAWLYAQFSPDDFNTLHEFATAGECITKPALQYMMTRPSIRNAFIQSDPKQKNCFINKFPFVIKESPSIEDYFNALVKGVHHFGAYGAISNQIQRVLGDDSKSNRRQTEDILNMDRYMDMLLSHNYKDSQLSFQYDKGGKIHTIHGFCVDLIGYSQDNGRAYLIGHTFNASVSDVRPHLDSFRLGSIVGQSVTNKPRGLQQSNLKEIISKIKDEMFEISVDSPNHIRVMFNVADRPDAIEEITAVSLSRKNTCAITYHTENNSSYTSFDEIPSGERVTEIAYSDTIRGLDGFSRFLRKYSDIITIIKDTKLKERFRNTVKHIEEKYSGEKANDEDIISSDESASYNVQEPPIIPPTSKVSTRKLDSGELHNSVIRLATILHRLLSVAPNGSITMRLLASELNIPLTILRKDIYDIYRNEKITELLTICFQDEGHRNYQPELRKKKKTSDRRKEEKPSYLLNMESTSLHKFMDHHEYDNLNIQVHFKQGANKFLLLSKEESAILNLSPEDNILYRNSSHNTSAIPVLRPYKYKQHRESIKEGRKFVCFERTNDGSAEFVAQPIDIYTDTIGCKHYVACIEQNAINGEPILTFHDANRLNYKYKTNEHFDSKTCEVGLQLLDYFWAPEHTIIKDSASRCITNIELLIDEKHKNAKEKILQDISHLKDDGRIETINSDGTSALRLKLSCGLAAFKKWILSYGSSITVVSPSELRDEILDIYKNLGERLSV